MFSEDSTELTVLFLGLIPLMGNENSQAAYKLPVLTLPATGRVNFSWNHRLIMLEQVLSPLDEKVTLQLCTKINSWCLVVRHFKEQRFVR